MWKLEPYLVAHLHIWCSMLGRLKWLGLKHLVLFELCVSVSLWPLRVVSPAW